MKIKLQVVRGFVCILFDEDYEDSSKMYICFKIISMYVNKQEDETEVSFVCEDNKDRAFTFKNFSDAQLHRMLGSYCPNVLFPYARELISDMVTRGGFPPLYLAPINFDVLYDQQLQKKQAEQKTTSSTS